MLLGIDIASYQRDPDFAKLRADGHDFAITKVTGEGNYINPYWSLNRDNARAAGLIVGTYDWVEPQGEQTGEEAAADYLNVVGPRQPGDLLCVDFETPEWASGPLGAAIEPWMRAYLYALRDRSGQPVIVYTAPYFLNETGAARWDWLGRDFLYWIAAPGQKAMLQDDAPWPGGTLVSPWREATLHQHQWHARSTAVAGEFDRDRFRGTRAELAAYGTPGGKVIGKKEDTGFTHAEGWLEPIRDAFDWGGAGIIVGRSVRAYNDQERAYYRRTWSAEGGYTAWVKE